ncbi:MAG: hypothetical protein JST54_32260 [Deltaproteobacteria bacterium]|nr:hypothetical protein [Deltaproteobacteria bacterium]
MGLEIVELVIHFEEEFGVELPDSEAGNLTTPGKFVDYIVAKKPSLVRADVAARVKTIIITQLGLDGRDYSEDAELIRDLGAG